MRAAVGFVSGVLLAAGAVISPAEAQFYGSFGSSYSVGGSGLQRSEKKQEGRIVRGYYNRFGDVVVTARTPPDADKLESAAEAGATPGVAASTSGGAPVRKSKRPPAASVAR